MGTDLDFLGFTKQTETLLRGVGANGLIKEFKRRNISTDALHKLTKEDFMQLGADKNLAENMVNVLRISKKKDSNIKLKPHERISDKIEILKLGEKQYDMIRIYLTYCRCRLKKERINFFVEPDKNLSASQILSIAADATLKEINEAELRLKELETAIIMPRDNQKCSYILYCIPIGGLCITTCMLLNKFWT